MFESHQKSTGTQYTMTATLLLVALVFVPAVLIVSRPLSYTSVSLAIACSGLCLVLARKLWMRGAHLTIPSIETPQVRLK